MIPLVGSGAFQDLFAIYPHRMAVLSMGAVLLVSGLCVALGRRFRFPTIVLLLAVGILLGPHVVGLIQPTYLGRGLRVVISIAVALILFEGAMSIDLGALRRRLPALIGVVVAAPPITLGLSGLAVHAFIGVPWETAWLAAALLTVSGPTVVLPLLKEVSLDSHLRALLEAESVVVAAVGVLMTEAVFELATRPGLSFGSAFLALGTDLAVGAVVGGVTFVLVQQALEVLARSHDSAERLLILGAVVASYAVAEILVQRSGIVTVTMIGALMSTADPARKAGRQFQSDITLIATSLVFVLLGAQLDMRVLGSIGPGALVIALGLMLIVRPLAVFAGTQMSDLSLRERGFIAWLGPRGLVTASMAALTEMQARQSGVPGAEILDELVLVAVLVTVVVQAGGARWAAARLGVLRPGLEQVLAVPAAGAVSESERAPR